MAIESEALVYDPYMKSIFKNILEIVDCETLNRYAKSFSSRLRRSFINTMTINFVKNGLNFSQLISFLAAKTLIIEVGWVNLSLLYNISLFCHHSCPAGQMVMSGQ